MPEENPKLFISYSWTSPEHEQLVLNLATELRENGVDVILDKWDLKEGHDAHAFMEKMVATDPAIKKVALVCDRLYAEKADGRSGGVGIEAQIISPEIYAQEDQGKFVAVVTERDDDGKPYLPTYYKSRIYIDLSDDDLYAKNFEQLLRWIFDEPLYIKPDLGKKPAFLTEAPNINLGTSSKFKRTLDAVRNNKSYCHGALNEYFEAFAENLERFRLASNGEAEFDDRVIENISQFIPYRNEAIELFNALAQYRNTIETHQQLHRFFEELIPYMLRPSHITSYRDWDFDNFKFIIHELFLYAIASLLKYECYDGASYLIRHHYYLEKSDEATNMVSFSWICQYMKSLEYRNKRLKLDRLSLRADLLEQRSKASGFKFKQLIQSDFVLYLRDCIDVLRTETYQKWWPETILYLGWRNVETFEIFARAQSKEYFEKLKCLFDIKEKGDLQPLMQAFREGKLTIPKWQFQTFSPYDLLGYELLATKP